MSRACSASCSPRKCADLATPLVFASIECDLDQKPALTCEVFGAWRAGRLALETNDDLPPIRGRTKALADGARLLRIEARFREDDSGAIARLSRPENHW